MKKEYKITDRTFEFAKIVVKLAVSLEEQHKVPKVLVTQVLKSGTSIGANVEEAQAGQSKADFIAKMAISCKEARETNYWLRLFVETDLVKKEKLLALIQESDELVRILTTIIKTAQDKH